MDPFDRTRRQLLKTALAGAAGLTLGAPVQRLIAAGQVSSSANTQRLADDLFVISLPGETNVVAYTRADGLRAGASAEAGVLLVDGASAAAADALMKAVGALPGGRPIQTLVNTHWHPEQTGLNEPLGKAGKTILAQENTRLWLASDVIWPWNGRRFKRLPKAAQPNKTFYDTGGELGADVRDVVYRHIPDAGHTDGDLYVYFPKQNVLAAGDAVSGAGWPVVDYTTGGWIGGIVGALQRLQTVANADTRIVPGRGPVLTLADLRQQSQMYGTVYERLTQLLNRGRGPDEAVAAKPTKEFDEKMGNGDEFVRRAFESLWGYLSPDA